MTNKQQLKEEAREFDIREGEKLADAFIRNYCNDHQKLRWLRGAFLDEYDKMNTMIEWLELADSLITKAYEDGQDKGEKEVNERATKYITEVMGYTCPDFTI